MLDHGVVGVSATDLLDLTAAAAARALDSGEIGAGELFDAYAARAREDKLNCFTWVADGPPSTPPSGSPLAGVPLAVKDLFCTENVPSQSGSRILEGYLPPYTATAVERLQTAGATLLGKTNQDEFAMGSSNENSAYGPVLNPWDPDARARRLLRGQRRGGGRGPRPVGAWHRHGRLDPPARRAVRDRRAEAHLRRRLALRDDRVRLLARPGRTALTRDVTDAALMLRHMVGRDERDATSLQFPHEIALPSAERLDGVRLGVPEELTGEGIEAGVLESFEAALRRLKRWVLASSVSTFRTPPTRCRPTT